MKQITLVLLSVCLWHAAQAQLINKVEYFLDSDPGFGNATNVSVSADSVINGFMFNVDVSTLMPGIHTLSIRSKDDQGTWSLTQNQYLYKFPPLINNNVLPTLVKLEYFVDTDPGFGNGIQIPFVGGYLINGLPFNALISNLSEGLHTLYIRGLDATGRWSLTQNQYLYKFPPVINGNVSPAITRLEYFVDTDPGFGLGTNIPITSDSVITNFSFNTSVASLAPGLHTLYIRSLDATGRWSLTQNQYLYKFPSVINGNMSPVITRLEYFVDTDPGFGLGTNVPITSDSVITNFSFNTSVASLASGLHTLYIRSLDATGRWSLTQHHYLYKFPSVTNGNISPAITRLEYFVDTDPGFGLGTNVPIIADSILSAVVFDVDVSNLSHGTHRLYIRSLDASGRWSLTRSSQFTRDQFKLFIQGYYTGGSAMNTVLANQGVGSNLLMTDTVTVELHNANYPYALKEVSKGILYTDGQLNCSFANSIGTYYIVIKHRNSIETWSNTPVAVGTNITTFDFSTAASKGYGNNLIQVEPSIWAIYNGDINQDGYIDGFDYPMFDNDAQNNVNGVYATTDLNGDGYVDGFDYPVFDSNNQSNVGILKP